MACWILGAELDIDGHFKMFFYRAEKRRYKIESLKTAWCATCISILKLTFLNKEKRILTVNKENA